MEEERKCDAAWYVERLEVRLFNRDAEGMLVERLGDEEVRWAANAVLRPFALVKDALEGVDCWLDEELVLPTGPCIPPFSPDDVPDNIEVEDLRKFARQTQSIQLRNSFGVGVFAGVIYAEFGAAAEREGVQFEMGLKPALGLIASSLLSPEDLNDCGDPPWAVRLERQLSQLRCRVPLMGALRPIVQRHGFLKHPTALLPSRRLRYAQRSMFLAGLIASGLEAGALLHERAPGPLRRKRLDERLKKDTQEGSERLLDLFHKTDEELEPLLGEASLRDQVAEELEFRLRNNRLSRMLAHLRRISRGERRRRGDDE